MNLNDSNGFKPHSQLDIFNFYDFFLLLYCDWHIGRFFQLSPHTGHFLLKQSDRLYFYLHVVTNSQNEPWSVRKRRLILNKPVVFPRLIKQAATAADSHLTPPRLQIQWQVCGGYHIAGPLIYGGGLRTDCQRILQLNTSSANEVTQSDLKNIHPETKRCVRFEICHHLCAKLASANL